jgi:hypothetical protein
VARCPECNVELEAGATQCHICGTAVSAEDGEWITLGTVFNQISADFAKETLQSQGIPAVVFSKSGFFGSAGLPLHPFFKGGSMMYRISVPGACREEAIEVMDMALGDNWERAVS